jgi:tetratricopeptide (TPR) repeat protein
MSQNSQNLSLSATSSLALPSYDTIPQSGVSQFVGREQELQTLHHLLQAHDQVAIAGTSGVGKTELAIQYATANLDHYTGGVCWLSARSDVGLQIVEFARVHFPNFTIPPGLTPATQVAYCWQNWTSLLAPPYQGGDGGVLLIIDDVTNYQQVQPYLPPPSSRFKVLMTTRQQLETPVQMLPLDVLTPPAALELLASRIGKYRVKDTRGKPFRIDSKRKQGKHKEAASPRVTKGVAEQLCEWLGYLPLGVELVGRYLEQERNLSLEKMRTRLQKQRLAHIQLEDDTTENWTTDQGVAAAFDLSWKCLDEEAQQLACLLSAFALAPIPWAQVESVYGQLYLPGALFGKLLNALPDNSEAEIENLINTLLENLKQARGKLVQLHLLQRTGEETYQLHPLIRELLRAKLEGLDQSLNIKKAFCQVMLAAAKQIPDSPNRELIETVTPAIPHVTEAATALRDFLSDEDLVECCEGLGWFYQSQGFFNQAAPWREQSLSVTQARCGSDNLDVASKLNNLAWIYYAQERYAEAEPLSVQALKICEQHLGSDHPLTVATRKNLEALYTVLKK